MRSLAALIEFAVMFVPTCAIYQAVAAKKAAARPPCPRSSHLEVIWRGSQIGFPYMIEVAEVVMTPIVPQRVKTRGRKGSWMN